MGDHVVQLGYDFIHFTPLQKLGSSGSPYSISDQLNFEAASPEQMQNFLTSWKDKVGFVTDVVWNHCASDSAWLSAHPEATYNLLNSAHLIPAFILDDKISKISELISTQGHEFQTI